MSPYRILLINPRTYPGESINIVEDKHPPLGLAYLAAFIRSKGYPVDILDMPASNISDENISTYVKAKGYDIVGITGMTHQITNGCSLAKEIKRQNPQVKIIFGGVHATFCFDELLEGNRYIDFIIRGEGELTFLEFLKALERGENNFHDIKGLAFFDKDTKRIIATGDRDFIPDLDVLPLPARDLLPIHEYLRGETIFGNPMLEIIASRGCPYGCIFCSSPEFWKRKVRFRSVDGVINEIEHLLSKYPARYFIFVDDGFTFRKDFLYSFCEKIIKNKLNIKWRCLARVDHVNREMLVLMKKAGCVKICYGVESGNQVILDFANKGISIGQVKRAFALTHDVGIATLALMIIGHPLETEKTILDSINLIREIRPFRYVFQCMCPYVGTKLYNEIAANTGTILSKRWEDYRSTEAPMFIPHGLTAQAVIRYHDEFMLENLSFPHLLRRIWIAFTLVGSDIFNKKFFFKPLYYSFYRHLPPLLKNFLDFISRWSRFRSEVRISTD
jgi:magnesium-protoporphyrin IX monomethyl ester (oxidative) cyclase